MDPQAEAQAIRRVRLLARGAFLWALCLLARLVYLQVFSHDELLRIADQQQNRRLEIPAPRGTIFDRTGQPLAMSMPVASVCVNPMRVPDPAVASGILAGVLGIDRRELFVRLREKARERRGFLWIARKITPQQEERLRSLRLDWIEFRNESKRFYPNGPLAAHVLGSVDHAEKGNGGAELGLNGELEGRPGFLRVTTDVKQRGFASEIASEPQAGHNITLTVDQRIQYVAERDLKAAVEANQCQTGSLIVMRPATGEILAMASYPTFDPNKPPAGDAMHAGRLNLAVSAPFEPGSVFKVITLAAALETTKLRPETVIPCGNGLLNLFGRVIHDHDPYGALSMADVLAKSSNIGAIQVGLRVGDAKMHEYVRRFGFGQRTGITLPGESPGRVYRLARWQKSSIGSVAMGHEVMSTTLQLAQAGAVIANGGFLVEPRIVLKRNSAGRVVQNVALVTETSPPRRVLQPETAITMRQMMEGVVLRGTGRKARLDGYSSGGKTGSAQIFDVQKKVYTHRYNATFLGFAPVTNPAIVVVVTLNGASKFGGAVAAPVFRGVAAAALRILDVPKDLPDRIVPQDLGSEEVDDLAIAGLGQAPSDMTAGPDGSLVEMQSFSGSALLIGPKVPNFHGKTMRSVLEESSAIGLAVEISGTGVARAQVPPAGSTLAAGERVRIQFAR